MSYDLKNLSADPDTQKATLTIIHPLTGAPVSDEEGNELKIILYGPDSNPVKKASRKIINSNLKQSVKKRRMSLSAEQIEARSLEVLVAATADWENLAYEGEALKCTPENARMIYTNVPVIREQVDEFINDRANFLGE